MDKPLPACYNGKNSTMNERRGRQVTTLSIDLGGTRIKLAVLREGQILRDDVFAVQSDAPLPRILAVLEEHVKQLLQSAPEPVAQAALAFPGIVARGQILSVNGKYEEAVGFDWHAWCRRCFALPLRIMNDAAAALTGEIRFGAGRGAQSAVIMIIGTGIGAAAALNGEVPEGPHGPLGVLGGHIAIEMKEPRPCICGSTGCVEAWAGTWAIRRQASASPRFYESCLCRAPRVDYRALADGVAQGDALSRELFDTAVRALCMGAVNLVHAFFPDVLILSGGPTHIPALCERITSYVHRHAWTPWGQVEVRIADRPEASVLLGLHAACLPR